MRVRLMLILVTWLSFAASLSAQPISPKDLPPELRPWVAWVLDEVHDHGCGLVQGRAVCLWPGRLALAVSESGARFELSVVADRRTALRLPGDLQRWPQEVRVDARAAPVVDAGGWPTLQLTAGSHRVSGRFRWSRLPESLPVPAEVALLDLKIDGRVVPAPRREAEGLLWLRARDDPEAAEDGESLRVLVFRRVADGIPVFVETVLSLEVSGKAREVRLEGALLADAVPVSVSGGLPAQVDEDGRLRVQVRGGRFTVNVLSRLDGPVDALGPPEVEIDVDEAVSWPDREVWVFQADETLRQVELSGAAAIDPSRTELPQAWRALPAFLLGSETRLSITERRRGQTEAAPDRIQLSRELWLDLDGGGFTARDRFGGRLGRTWRIDLAAPGRLGRTEVDGQDQLITENPQTGAAGVEVRGSALNLVAESRLPRSGPLRAVGWQADVEQLSATLHLPPGWSLLTAAGVDSLPGTWTSRWTLLGFFLALLASLAVHRLLGLREAFVALAALVLAHGEPGAPFLVWLSLLGAMALRSVAPAGRLGSIARIWWLASVAVLLLILVPFARDQIRTALFPQVGPSRGAFGGTADSITGGMDDFRGKAGVVGRSPDAPAPLAKVVPAEGEPIELEDKVAEDVRRRRAPAAAPPAAPPAPAAKRFGRFSSAQEQGYSYNVALEQDPHAVLQTGPAVPSWRWRSFSLRWNGPVDRDHELRLWLVSPRLNRLLTLLRLALVGLLAAALLLWPRRLRLPTLPRRGAGAAAALAASLLLAALSAAQELPNRDLLEELKRRLTRDEPCEPRCTTTASLLLRIDDRRLSFSAEVHTAAAATWRVPGPVATWVPTSVSIDGVQTAALARLVDGFLHVRLAPGVHRLDVAGPTPPQDSFALQFGDRPRHARAATDGWEIVGFRDDGPANASVQLTRRLREGRTARSSSAGVYAPWLEVTRTLRIGVSWQVATEVRRVSPVGSPLAVKIPLLSGESPIDMRFEVEDGEIAVGLGRDDVRVGWTSTLEQTESLELEAPEGQPWSEVWRLQCGVVWQCEASGMPPVRRVDGGVLQPEFRPWPGEAVAVDFSHPEGTPGQTLTLDRVDLQVILGSRLSRVALDVQARSSREESLSLGIPEGAEVQQVSVDGAERPSRPVDGTLRVTLPAGEHRVEVRWHEERGSSVFYGLPRVELSGSAANVHLAAELPPERWLLATSGPAWGPSVLYWAYLLFAVAAALALSRVAGSPLDARQWALLALGLSQLPAIGALLVAGFFLALAWRQRRPPHGAAAFDALQLLLVGWALLTALLLYQAVEDGLLFRPDIQVGGNGSSETVLRWYADRVAAATPAAGVLSLPLWVYRGAMLLWSLWLAASLVRWVGWAWRAWTTGGTWRPLPLRLPARKLAGSKPAGDPEGTAGQTEG